MLVNSKIGTNPSERRPNNERPFWYIRRDIVTDASHDVADTIGRTQPGAMPTQPHTVPTPNSIRRLVLTEVAPVTETVATMPNEAVSTAEATVADTRPTMTAAVEPTVSEQDERMSEARRAILAVHDDSNEKAA